MAYRRTAAIQGRLDATRARIVTAAHDLVAEHGYAGCSVALVAEAAEVATGSVYRHFSDKSALFAEVFRTSSRREVEAVAAAAAGPGPVAQRVARMVETFAHRALANPRLAYALIAEPVDPRIEAERLILRRAWRDVFAAVVTQGVAAGELPPQDPQVAASAVVGALAEALVAPLSIAAPHADATTSACTTDVVPDLTAFVIRALGATP